MAVVNRSVIYEQLGASDAHAVLTTAIHGVGVSTVASAANIATHAALTTGVHGLAITAGQTLTVTTGGTLGTGAYATIADYATLASPAFTGVAAFGGATIATIRVAIYGVNVNGAVLYLKGTATTAESILACVRSDGSDAVDIGTLATTGHARLRLFTLTGSTRVLLSAGGATGGEATLYGNTSGSVVLTTDALGANLSVTQGAAIITEALVASTRSVPITWNGTALKLLAVLA